MHNKFPLTTLLPLLRHLPKRLGTSSPHRPVVEHGGGVSLKVAVADGRDGVRLRLAGGAGAVGVVDDGLELLCAALGEGGGDGGVGAFLLLGGGGAVDEAWGLGSVCWFAEVAGRCVLGDEEIVVPGNVTTYLGSTTRDSIMRFL